VSFWDKAKSKLPFINSIIEWAKRVSLPGFNKVPIYNVVVFFFYEVKQDVLPVRAKSISFTFFLAIFPAIIFLFTLIPYIPVENLQNNLIALIQEVLPGNVFQFIDSTIQDIVKKPRGGLLSIGFLLALYISSNGVIGMIDSFDKSNETFVKRNGLTKRWIAIKLTLILFFLLFSSLVLIVIGNKVLGFVLGELNISRFYLYLFMTLKYIIILLLYFISISTIYYYGPAVKKKWDFMSAGSTLATFLCIAISLGFSFFVNNFGAYNKVYGSIGTIIALLMWLYLNSFSLLIGFELNAAIAYNKNLLEGEKELFKLDS